MPTIILLGFAALGLLPGFCMAVESSCPTFLNIDSLQVDTNELQRDMQFDVTPKLLLSGLALNNESQTKPQQFSGHLPPTGPYWVKSKKSPAQGGDLFLHCHYGHGLASVSRPVSANHCKVQVTHSGYWVSQVGALQCTSR